jgi:hypothetical protein
VRRRNRLIFLGVAAVVAAGALTTGAFVAGSHNPTVTVASGNAHVGDGVASAFADGQWYGIPMDVAWLGTDGSWRQNGTPACLAWTGSSRDVAIQFGWVPITSPGGGGAWRQVVWVSCGT